MKAIKRLVLLLTVFTLNFVFGYVAPELLNTKKVDKNKHQSTYEIDKIEVSDSTMGEINEADLFNKNTTFYKGHDTILK
jgi:NADH:ubiquinone oxidoreductase subunit 3 (subunit A)